MTFMAIWGRASGKRSDRYSIDLSTSGRPKSPSGVPGFGSPRCFGDAFFDSLGSAGSPCSESGPDGCAAIIVAGIVSLITPDLPSAAADNSRVRDAAFGIGYSKANTSRPDRPG